MASLVCGVDVGTGSARAGIFDLSGRMLGIAKRQILLAQPQAGHAEHDSEDIWRAACAAVREAREAAGAAPDDIRGIAFDATCSLVVRGLGGEQVGVSAGGDRWDTIAWFDHRAAAEADECTATGHRVIDRAGGAMSPEMQVPKLMWLKRHLPAAWARAAYLFDLSDFLAWKAAGTDARSQGTLAAKWTYRAGESPAWRRDFLERVGLSDLFERGGLPAQATAVGADLGTLAPEAARAMGLTEACRVACGTIDAYAGALGLIGGLPDEAREGHAALIAGTSSCVVTLSRQPKTFAGAWGPYLGAALPDLWLSEGGQSASGAALDRVIPLAGGGLAPDAATHDRIAARIAVLRGIEGDGFARRLHVLPDFHGNRTPFADPHALGVVSGLSLDASFDALCRLYWRSAVALALGLRQILEAMGAGGAAVETLHVAGGQVRNPLLSALYADATGCRLLEPADGDAVLLGTAMIAAAGAGLFPALSEACAAMRRPARERRPDPAAQAALERDYRIFREMQRHRQALDAMG